MTVADEIAWHPLRRIAYVTLSERCRVTLGRYRPRVPTDPYVRDYRIRLLSVMDSLRDATWSEPQLVEEEEIVCTVLRTIPWF